MKTSTIFALILTGILLLSQNSYAQTKITFQVNLKPQLEDSVFIPGRDLVKLKGNQYPLTGKGITLRDSAPKDSVYTVEVSFPGHASGKKISYNFILETEPKTINESMPRQLLIRNGEHTLDALYFDSFAW